MYTVEANMGGLRFEGFIWRIYPISLKRYQKVGIQKGETF